MIQASIAVEKKRFDVREERRERNDKECFSDFFLRTRSHFFFSNENQVDLGENGCEKIASTAFHMSQNEEVKKKYN